MTTSSAAKDKIIVALDFPEEAEALRLIGALGDRVGFYKVGLQMFIRHGPAIVRRVQEAGVKVFLDLKLHDIPNTVKHAVRSAAELEVDMLTIHLTGGAAMAAAAAEAADGRMLLLGVTVLTSSSRETLAETGVQGAVEDQVLKLASIAAAAGIGGVVASPLEISLLRQVFPRNLKIVTPGVRPDWAEANDQKRVLTPAQAIQNGADYLVIGRPVTAHKNPIEAVEKVIEELESV